MFKPYNRLACPIIALLLYCFPNITSAQSPFAGGYDGEFLIQTFLGEQLLTTATEPDVVVVIAEDGGIRVSFNQVVITGTVNNEGLITFDPSPQSFETGQITEGVINAIGSSVTNTIETRNTFTATFLGALPKITQQPLSQTLAPGGTATFSVEAANVDSYEWEQNGSIVPEVDGPTLEIANASIDDVGTYQVRLSNTAGDVLSDLVNLNIVIEGENPLYDGRRFQKIADGDTILEDGNTPVKFEQGSGPQGSGFFSARAAEQEVLINMRETEMFNNVTDVRNSIYKWSNIGLERIADHTLDLRQTVTRLAGGPNAYENDEIIFISTDNRIDFDLQEFVGQTVFRGNPFEYETLFDPDVSDGVNLFGKTITINFASGVSVSEDGAILFSGRRRDDRIGPLSNYIPSNLYYLRFNEDLLEWEVELAQEGGFTPEGSTKEYSPLDVGLFTHTQTTKEGTGGTERLLAFIVNATDRSGGAMAVIVNDEAPVIVVDTDMTIDGVDVDVFEFLQIFDDWIYFSTADVFGNYLMARVDAEGTIEVLAKTGDPVPDRPGRQLGAFTTISPSLINTFGNFAVSEAGVYFGSDLKLEDQNPGGAGLYLKPEGQPFHTVTDDRDVYDGKQAEQFQIWPYAARRADCGRDDLVIQVGFGAFPGGGNALYTNIIVDLPTVSSVSINATDQVVVTFNSSLGVTHSIESSTNMQDWAVVETGIEGIEGDITWNDSNPFDPDRIYYRVTSN